MNNNTFDNSRSAYWDNIKGCLIFFVFYMHCIFQLNGVSVAHASAIFLNAFLMEVFVFTTGYFSSKNSRRPKAIVKLLAAYFLFDGLFIIFSMLTGKTFDYLQPDLHTWYLLAVIAWRLIIPYIRKKPISLIVAFCISILVGFIPSINHTLAIRRIIAFFPFFLAGYMFTPENLNSFQLFVKKKRWAIIPICLFLMGGILFVTYKTFPFDFNASLMIPYSSASDILVRIAIFVIGCIAIILFLSASPSRQIPFLTRFGKNSLSIYLIHRVFALAFQNFFPRLFGNYMQSKFVIPAALIFSFILSIILSTDVVSKQLNNVLNAGIDIVFKPTDRPRSKWWILYLIFAMFLAIGPIVILLAK